MYEFFQPFAHVEGKYEWCRIRSPTHGVFDTFILLGSPAIVYVAEAAGERFMRDRYPECQTYRVPEGALAIRETGVGQRVTGRLRASVGPVAEASMRFDTGASTVPRAVPYGGRGRPVWDSPRWTCWGVDLVLDATVEGRIRWRDQPETRLEGVPGLVTLGSFGRIAPLASSRQAVKESRRGRTGPLPVATRRRPNGRLRRGRA